MFNISKEVIGLAVRDRLIILLTLAGVILALIIIISGLINIRPSDIQVPVRYSGYGITNLYRDKWYYLISFIFSGLMLLIVHPLIMLKLWEEKGRDYAIGFSALTLLVALIGILVSSAVFRVVSVSL